MPIFGTDLATRDVDTCTIPLEDIVGTLFSAFDIARTGLQVAQVQLDVVAHNIANVNKPGFSRQRVELMSNIPLIRPFGMLGRGVAVAQITRIRDEFLDILFRRQIPGFAEAEIRAEVFTRIEDIFLEPGPNGLSTRINLFFDSLNDFANNVESQAVRQGALNEADAVAALLQETANRIFLQRTNINEEVINFVPEINSIAQRIADMNVRIRGAELSGQVANDARDERGVLIDQLARFVNVFTRERVDGQVDVLVSGDVLVNGGDIRLLEAIRDSSLDPERNDLARIQFVDTGQVFTVLEGEVFAALGLRDTTLVALDARIDSITSTIIEQINLIHSQGNGLSNLQGTFISSNAVTDPTLAIDAAGLPFAISSGTFQLDVFNGNTPVSTTVITVTAGVTTLNDIVAAIGAGASVTVDNRLQLSFASPLNFTLSNDTSGVLGSLGVNVLFTGTDARDIAVNQDILNNPSLLSSGFSLDPLETGDNSAALAMAAVRTGLFLDGNSASINDFYESTIVQLGVEARGNFADLETERAFVESIELRREEVAGVSLDEEVTMLLQFQRAFEASARIVTVTDRMLDSLLAMAL